MYVSKLSLNRHPTFWFCTALELLCEKEIICLLHSLLELELLKCEVLFQIEVEAFNFTGNLPCCFVVG